MLPKKVLITGASSKIGKIFAQHLQSKGYFTYLHYNNSFAKIQALSQEKNVFIQADFNDLETTLSTFTNIFEIYGYPDIIINNASNFTNDKFGMLVKDNFYKNINIGAFTPLFLLSEISSKLPNNSLVINMLDYFANHIPTRNFLSYGIGKSILSELTKTLAVTMAPKTRVNAIAISPIVFDPAEDPDSFLFRATDNVLGYKPDIKDLIATLDYIITNNSITGEIIRVDSGKHLQMKSDYFI